MLIQKSDLDEDNAGMWDRLCDLAGLPKTNEEHPWNERAFAQLEITGVILAKYNHEE